jgi:hypothetical protein
MTDASLRQSLLLAVLSVVLVAGCPPADPVNPPPPPPIPPPPPVSSIVVKPANPTILIGGTPGGLTVDLLDQNGNLVTGAAGSVAWSALAPIVTFTPTSPLVTQLTGVSPGSTTVTAVFTPTPSGATRQATTTVTVAPQQITTVSLSPAMATIPALTSATPFTPTFRDQNGGLMAGTHTVTWQSSNTGIATIGLGSGTITGVTPGGPVTIRATSSANQSVFGDAVVFISAAPFTPVNIAYALAEQPSAASYTADPALQFNGLGGPITVTRQGTGQYAVTIPGFGGAAGASRIPFVTAVTSSSVVCLALGWNMIGAADATVAVDCSTANGVLTDSRFSIFAVGEGGLPGRFAFANSGPLPAGFAPVTLGTASAWSSTLGSPQLARDNTTIVGRFLLTLKSTTPLATDVPVVQPSGASGARCQLSSWSAVLDILCFPAGAITGFADARFSGMLLDQGRAGKRFGAVHSGGLAVVSRNSTGGLNTVSSTGTGIWRVTFGNLGRPAGAKETVLVTAQAISGAAFCNPSNWSTLGNDLVVDVVCFNGAGALSNLPTFIAVLIE